MNCSTVFELYFIVQVPNRLMPIIPSTCCDRCR